MYRPSCPRKFAIYTFQSRQFLYDLRNRGEHCRVSGHDRRCLFCGGNWVRTKFQRRKIVLAPRRIFRIFEYETLNRHHSNIPWQRRDVIPFERCKINGKDMDAWWLVSVLFSQLEYTRRRRPRGQRPSLSISPRRCILFHVIRPAILFQSFLCPRPESIFLY